MQYRMFSAFRVRMGMLASFFLVMYLFVAPAGQAQTGGGASSSGSSSSTASAPSGSGAVESAIISYQATREVAKELKRRFCGANNAFTGTSKNFLLGTPTNLSAVESWLAFDLAVKQLEKQYDALAGKPVGAPGPLAPLGAAMSAGASAALTAITGAVNTIKTQTTQTSSTFTPVDQVLFSDLEHEMNGNGTATCQLVTTAYPGMVEQAAKEIGQELDDLLAQQQQVRQKRHPKDPDDYKDDGELQALDAEVVILEQTLGNETANMNGSTILIGRALTDSLTATYHVITLANAAAGGGTRSNVYFLINVLFPAPHPSYNGGAAVAYSVRTNGGLYEDADTIYFVFGYTKWKQPKLTDEKNKKGFSNFAWPATQ